MDANIEQKLFKVVCGIYYVHSRRAVIGHAEDTIFENCKLGWVNGLDCNCLQFTQYTCLRGNIPSSAFSKYHQQYSDEELFEACKYFVPCDKLKTAEEQDEDKHRNCKANLIPAVEEYMFDTAQQYAILSEFGNNSHLEGFLCLLHTYVLILQRYPYNCKDVIEIVCKKFFKKEGDDKSLYDCVKKTCENPLYFEVFENIEQCLLNQNLSCDVKDLFNALACIHDAIEYVHNTYATHMTYYTLFRSMWSLYNEGNMGIAAAPKLSDVVKSLAKGKII